ncbi:uncharacterized protein MELLADRAFT_68000 [Melampsora larici-populina 98AG31]|uniref:Uncharacterized protein n=1 Tax=Melampsora larici-populina (strain 98AG31 / pathotype 3-4-7) TaxID=747676 RepID=F4S581_MELLP|nr:uncharacterized protein MELLADRAFT_68000 [Melampsora larici-populina 98AG31]EGG00205.1 hypothetical protein MELLADRAFT_68000 [Melampsora larici-populina 98AG31]
MTHSKPLPKFVTSVKEKCALFESNSSFQQNFSIIPAPTPMSSALTSPSAFFSHNASSPVPSVSNIRTRPLLPNAQIPTRRVTAPVQRKVSRQTPNVKSLVNKFEAKFVFSKKRPPYSPTSDEPTTSQSLSKKRSKDHTRAVRASFMGILNSVNSRSRPSSQFHDPKRLSSHWLDEDTTSAVTTDIHGQSSHQSLSSQIKVKKRPSLINISRDHLTPQKPLPEPVSKGFVDATKHQLEFLTSCPTAPVLLDELPFKNPSQPHDHRRGDLFLSLIREESPYTRGPERDTNMYRGSIGLRPPQQVSNHTLSEISFDPPTLIQHTQKKRIQDDHIPRSLLPDSKPLQTSHIPVSGSIKFPTVSDPKPDPPSNDINMRWSHSVPSASSDLIPLATLPSSSTRFSLPNFSNSHLARPGMISIPFPSFEDDEEYGTSEPTVHSALDHGSSLCTGSTSYSHLSIEDPSHPIHSSHQQTKPLKPARPNARSFLIGRKFDVDNESLNSLQRPSEDEDFLGPSESPTAKGSKSWLMADDLTREIKPFSMMPRFNRRSSASQSGAKSQQKPHKEAPRLPTSTRTSSIRRFSLRKLSGSRLSVRRDSEVSSTANSMTSGDDSCRNALEVERCSGVGSKMFESSIRRFKSIVTAPIRQPESEGTLSNHQIESHRHRHSSLRTPSLGSLSFSSASAGHDDTEHQTWERKEDPEPLSPPQTSDVSADQTLKYISPLRLLQRNYNIEESPSQVNKPCTPSTEACDLSNRSFPPLAGPSNVSPIHQDINELEDDDTVNFSSGADQLTEAPDTIVIHNSADNTARVIIEADESDEAVPADSAADLARLNQLFHSWRLLCAQVDEELKLSKERWPDTEYSKDILSTFATPSTHDAILEFLTHSRDTYRKTCSARRLNSRMGHKSTYPSISVNLNDSPRSSCELELTPPPKHPFGSRPATPVHITHASPSLSANKRRSQYSATPSPVVPQPLIVTLPVPSAFVSPERFNSPSDKRSSLYRSRNSSNSSLLNPSSRPGSRLHMDPPPNDSNNSSFSIKTRRALVETRINVTPSPKRTLKLTRVQMLSKLETDGRSSLKKENKSSTPISDRTSPIYPARPSSYAGSIISNNSTSSPNKTLGTQSRNAKKAWKLGDLETKSVHKTISQSSFWESNENSLVLEVDDEPEEETGVLVASGENSFAANVLLNDGFNPGRSLCRYPSSRRPLTNKSSARSMVVPKKPSLFAINRI